MSNIYLEEFERVGRIAFAMWNRDPASVSFGSFDRQYWGWKYKDFSDATLQYAVRLAVEYAAHENNTSTIPELLEGFVTYCKSIQSGDGSFDQCYPHERTPGVVYDILSALIYVRRSPFFTENRSRAELDGVIAKAARFALATDEKHGPIANHFAHYAYELYNYASFANDERARAKARDYLERTLELFDPEEGWFQEYGGPDAGYQTRTLRYLAKLSKLTEFPGLGETIHKAAGFVEQMLMPDGSIHPMLGSRSTALVYPSSFETLAVQDIRYRSVADKVYTGWLQKKVPLPSHLDFSNAIRLADDALEAAVARRDEPAPVRGESSRRESLEFPRAGISIRRTLRRAFYLGHRLGGVVVVYERSEGGPWKLVLEDSGYIIKYLLKSDIWISRMPGAGTLHELTDDRFVVTSRFHRSLHEEIGPARMILLRILNLTILRIQSIGDLFRRVVVKRLMGGRNVAPLELKREISISENEITITDMIAGDAQFAVNDGALVYLCRRITGMHMASARYFQEQELERNAIAWQQPTPLSLNVPMTRVVSTARLAR